MFAMSNLMMVPKPNSTAECCMIAAASSDSATLLLETPLMSFLSFLAGVLLVRSPPSYG
jgi:hypothetical protein